VIAGQVSGHLGRHDGGCGEREQFDSAVAADCHEHDRRDRSRYSVTGTSGLAPWPITHGRDLDQCHRQHDQS
jgi:hypothetical protein